LFAYWPYFLFLNKITIIIFCVVVRCVIVITIAIARFTKFKVQISREMAVQRVAFHIEPIEVFHQHGGMSITKIIVVSLINSFDQLKTSTKMVKKCMVTISACIL